MHFVSVYCVSPIFFTMTCYFFIFIFLWEARHDTYSRRAGVTHNVSSSWRNYSKQTYSVIFCVYPSRDLQLSVSINSPMAGILLLYWDRIMGS